MDWIVDYLTGLPAPLVVVLLSMLPILELRFAIPFAYFQYSMPWVETLCLAAIGNLLPVPFIIILGKKILHLLSKVKVFARIVEKLEKKASKNADKIQSYAFWGLILFVAIPWPGTGAWTGALIACFLQMRLRKAFPAIALGVLIAGFLMCGITYGFIDFLRF